MEDINRDAQYLAITSEQFVASYLEKMSMVWIIKQSISHVISCRKMAIENWEIVNRTVAKNIHILTSSNAYQVS